MAISGILFQYKQTVAWNYIGYWMGIGKIYGKQSCYAQLYFQSDRFLRIQRSRRKVEALQRAKRIP